MVTKTDVKSPNPVRGVLAVLLGSLAISLILASVIMMWLGRTLTDTDTYVSKVGPLVTNEAIQDFAVDRISESLINSNTDPGQIQAMAAQVLGPQNVAGKTEDQLQTDVKSSVEQTISGIVTSQAFTDLWLNTNRTVHQSLIEQLNSEGTSLQLDFTPVLSGIVDMFGNTGLAAAKEQIQIQPEMGKVKLEGEQIKRLRDGYDNFKRSIWLTVTGAIVATAAAVAVSNKRLKTMRRIALVTGIFAGLIAMLLSAGSLVKPAGIDAAQQQLALVLFDTLTGDLRRTMLIISVIGISGALGSLIFQKFVKKSV